MQSIQADAVSEWAQALAPTFLSAAQALVEEINTPGSHADLTGIVAQADAPAKALAAQALGFVQNWTSFDMASGVDEDAPTPQQIADSQAAVVMGVWMRRFADRAFEDEYSQLGVTPGSFAQLKLLVRMCTHTELVKTGLHPLTGDPILFDVWDTPEAETKRQMAAFALFDAMDFLYKALGPDASKWRWGNLHTLTLEFLAPMDALRIPLKTEKAYPTASRGTATSAPSTRRAIRSTSATTRTRTGRPSASWRARIRRRGPSGATRSRAARSSTPRRRTIAT